MSEILEIGDKFGVNLRQRQAGASPFGNDLAVERFNPRINVCAVKSIKAAVEQFGESIVGVLHVERMCERMTGGELPAAVDDFGNAVVGSELRTGNGWRHDGGPKKVQFELGMFVCFGWERHDGAFTVSEPPQPRA